VYTNDPVHVGHVVDPFSATNVTGIPYEVAIFVLNGTVVPELKDDPSVLGGGKNWTCSP
jgi:hypothetical protein